MYALEGDIKSNERGGCSRRMETWGWILSRQRTRHQIRPLAPRKETRRAAPHHWQPNPRGIPERYPKPKSITANRTSTGSLATSHSRHEHRASKSSGRGGVKLSETQVVLLPTFRYLPVKTFPSASAKCSDRRELLHVRRTKGVQHQNLPRGRKESGFFGASAGKGGGVIIVDLASCLLSPHVLALSHNRRMRNYTAVQRRSCCCCRCRGDDTSAAGFAWAALHSAWEPRVPKSRVCAGPTALFWS